MDEDLSLLASCLDVTSLRGDETEADIKELCARAADPGAGLPPVAAVCVLSRFVPLARAHLRGSCVRVACATGGFPSGKGSKAERVAEIRRALQAGAEEIDTVLPPYAVDGADGDDARAVEELRAVRAVCGTVVLKVILETGRLKRARRIEEAAAVAIAGGADFLKTSTGFAEPGATPKAARVMMRTVRRAFEETGTAVGVKVSGGIKTRDQAAAYLAILREELGEEWAVPARFRIGSSGLLGDLVRTGAGAGAAG